MGHGAEERGSVRLYESGSESRRTLLDALLEEISDEEDLNRAGCCLIPGYLNSDLIYQNPRSSLCLLLFTLPKEMKEPLPNTTAVNGGAPLG